MNLFNKLFGKKEKREVHTLNTITHLDMSEGITNDKETQYKLIKKHLLSGKPITALEALNRYGCFRLSAHIFELRKHYNISMEWKHKNGKRFGEYKLIKK